MAAAILLACAGWGLFRTNGFTSEFVSDLAWRWAPTPEDRLVHASDKPAAIALAPAVIKIPEPVAVAPAPVAVKIIKPVAEWPGFRGPHRDDVIPGVRIETDWSKSPPVEMWRRPVGPGWSSFAVHGDLLYTQEQRGSDEVVACYKVSTGEPVWTHRDPARFWESNAGAGPRATPTLSNGRVYAFGATGIVNALDAGSGAVVWSRNAGVDTDVKVPDWGFASSPLVLDDLVVVAAAGKLAAYDIATGEPRWFGPNGRYGYSSAHLVTIDKVPQILLTSGPGITSLGLDGAKLWEFALPAGARIVQPAIAAEGDLLVGEGEGHNLHRIAVSHGSGGWTVEERWNSNGLKPYFSDFVVHNGYAYGFDGNILACIDLKDGKRVWKGGRYGSGQLVLLTDQDVLLVLSEEGGLALAAATPGQFKELARFPAIEGKTWNHPALVGDVLLVRNGEEMAAFRLKVAP
jgi:outer membrane protein assembly factor BamB